MTFIAIWFNIDIGPMKNLKYTPLIVTEKYLKNSSMYYMILPIMLMIILVFIFLYITGDGKILNGSGSSSIFYTVSTTLLFMLFYYLPTNNMTLKFWLKTALDGAKNLFP